MTLLAPLRIEAWALRRGAPRAPVVRTGIGARASAGNAAAPLVAAGFGGALSAELRPADIVVASEVVGPDGDRIPCEGTSELEAALRAAGLRVHRGALATATQIVRGRERERLSRAGGALAADLESFWLVRAARGRPFAAVRVIVDTPGRELTNPLATLRGGIAAYRALKQAACPLAAWQVGSREPTIMNEETCQSQ